MCKPPRALRLSPCASAGRGRRSLSPSLPRAALVIAAALLPRTADVSKLWGRPAGWLMASWLACPTAQPRASALRSSPRDPGGSLQSAARSYQPSKASLPGKPGRHQTACPLGSAHEKWPDRIRLEPVAAATAAPIGLAKVFCAGGGFTHCKSADSSTAMLHVAGCRLNLITGYQPCHRPHPNANLKNSLSRS